MCQEFGGKFELGFSRTIPCLFSCHFQLVSVFVQRDTDFHIPTNFFYKKGKSFSQLSLKKRKFIANLSVDDFAEKTEIEKKKFCGTSSYS